jgi:hypothetical protein
VGGASGVNGSNNRCMPCLVGKLEGMRLLGRPKRRWENNIKMYIKGIVREGVEWIHLA